MTKKHSLFIVFAVLTAVLLCGCGGAAGSKAEDNIISAGEYGNVYEISEFLDETQYDEYMNDAGDLFVRLQAFRSRLVDSSELAFCAFANNFIEAISLEIPETCMVNYGTEYAAESVYEIDGERIAAAEAIQVSENFLALFPLEISEGRGFEASDFNCRNAGTVPVVLGNAYRTAFHLGDTFEGYYIFERRSFTVIGFADAGSAFWLRSGNRLVPYDNFIIMPFENISEDSFSARAVLLQQLCGFIAAPDGRDSALETIREYLTECSLESWSEAIAVSEKSLRDKMRP